MGLDVSAGILLGAVSSEMRERVLITYQHPALELAEIMTGSTAEDAGRQSIEVALPKLDHVFDEFGLVGLAWPPLGRGRNCSGRRSQRATFIALFAPLTRLVTEGSDAGCRQIFSVPERSERPS